MSRTLMLILEGSQLGLEKLQRLVNNKITSINSI